MGGSEKGIMTQNDTCSMNPVRQVVLQRGVHRYHRLMRPRGPGSVISSAWGKFRVQKGCDDYSTSRNRVLFTKPQLETTKTIALNPPEAPITTV